jgi:hypothetical protein
MSNATAARALSVTMPAVLTETNTAGLDDVITEIAQILLDESAMLDPNLVVVEQDGHLALGSRDGVHGEPFIALPTQVLIPINDLVWADDSTNVDVTGGADSLSYVQRELLDLHIALWNATNKLATFQATHPRAAALHAADLVDAIRKIRPSFSPGSSTRDMLRTRTFGLRSGESSASVVMPILELADHHPYGAAYVRSDGGLGADYCFIDDNGLSYVSYGPHRDAVDLACLYGYATDFTTFFVSAPMTVDLKGFGTFSIERTVNRQKTASWRVDDGKLAVNYLLLDACTGLFDSLHRPVREYLLGQGASRSQATSLAIDVADVILSANHEWLSGIVIAADGVTHDGASTIGAAAAHQRAVVDVIGDLA